MTCQIEINGSPSLGTRPRPSPWSRRARTRRGPRIQIHVLPVGQGRLPRETRFLFDVNRWFKATLTVKDAHSRTVYTDDDDDEYSGPGRLLLAVGWQDDSRQAGVARQVQGDHQRDRHRRHHTQVEHVGTGCDQDGYPGKDGAPLRQQWPNQHLGQLLYAHPRRRAHPRLPGWQLCRSDICGQDPGRRHEHPLGCRNRPTRRRPLLPRHHYKAGYPRQQDALRGPRSGHRPRAVKVSEVWVSYRGTYQI